MLLTGSAFPVIVLAVSIVLNSVALIYGTVHSIPFGYILIMVSLSRH